MRFTSSMLIDKIMNKVSQLIKYSILPFLFVVIGKCLYSHDHLIYLLFKKNNIFIFTLTIIHLFKNLF